MVSRTHGRLTTAHRPPNISLSATAGGRVRHGAPGGSAPPERLPPVTAGPSFRQPAFRGSSGPLAFFTENFPYARASAGADGHGCSTGTPQVVGPVIGQCLDQERGLVPIVRNIETVCTIPAAVRDERFDAAAEDVEAVRRAVERGAIPRRSLAGREEAPAERRRRLAQLEQSRSNRLSVREDALRSRERLSVPRRSGEGQARDRHSGRTVSGSKGRSPRARWSMTLRSGWQSGSWRH